VDIDSTLKTFQRFGIHLGLERIQKLLASLGNPHHQVPVIHVAGTNGKGSVCAYLSSVLTEAGYRTGRYTSPHLVDWTERFCLNEQPISREELCQLLLQVEAASSHEEDLPTQFEVLTAAAWLYFAQQQVDVAVVEVGLGGRLDATNVCDRPLVTIITSISLDHVEVLGSTIADIAAEKAGILKPECPVVIGPLPPDAQEVVRSRVLELKCPYITPQPARQIATGWAEYGEQGSGEAGEQGEEGENSKFLLQNPKLIKYPLPLQGQFQLTNSALAIAALQILQKQGWEISEADIISGIAKSKWLGRMQWTTWNKHKLLVDGAHNPASAEVLRDYVDTIDVQQISSNQSKIQNLESNIGVSWVMGMRSSKDHAGIFKALLRPNDRLYLTPVLDPSPANQSELAKLAQNICPLSFCSTYPDLSSALEAAFASTDNLVVLCGSLYLVGDFFQTLSGE